MKKYFLIATVIVSICWMAPCVNAKNGIQKSSVNLVKNASFENNETGWNIPEKSAEIVEGVAHNGSHSLYYKNTDHKRYNLFTQGVDVKPGQLLKFSVWVKGKGVKGRGGGIFMQSHDVDKKHIAGTPWGGFPETISGSFDWTKISGEYLVPNNASSTSVGIYLRNGSTGEVWFDDIEIQLVKHVSFTSRLKFPNYRGLLTKDNNTPWQIVTRVQAHPKWKYQVDVISSLKNSDGKVLFTQNDSLSLRGRDVIEIQKPKDLPPGNYSLQQKVSSSNGQIALTKNFPIHIVNSMPRVYIDSQGFTVVGGKRFFPLGIYTGGHGAPEGELNSKDSDLKRMADAGLNTVLSYSYANIPNRNGKEFLDRVARNNMHVIYSIKDMYNGHSGYPRNGISGQEAAIKQVKSVKDSPALLAWYTNDEMGGAWLKALQSRYDEIVKLDEHPTYMVSNKPQVNAELSTMTDVLGMDPYPIGNNKNINFVTQWTSETVKATHGDKGVWMVLQLHNLKHHRATLPDQPPTLNEMRNMSYQSLINGAKGIIYYAYHWLFFTQDENGKRVYSQEAFNRRWPDVKRTIGEMSSYIDVILHDQKVSLGRIIPTTTNLQVQMINDQLSLTLPLTVQYQAWEYQDKLYIMVVNTSESKSQSLSLQIPDRWHLSDTKVQGIEAELSNNVLKLDLQPIASGTIILER